MKRKTAPRSIVNVLALTVVLGTALSASAAKPRASCYLLNQKDQTIQGVNTDKRYEIASVSKIMTSLWAVSTLGAEYRFETKVHLVAVDKNLYDVHIEGSSDPFYNREQLQFLISQLNEMGVHKIRTLSFDENFKYLNSTRQSSVVVGHYATSYPTMTVVEGQLKSTIGNVASGYDAVFRRGKEILEMTLPKAIDLTVKEIKQMKIEEFRQNGIFATNDVKIVVQKSIPLMDLLKEMNRSSNNYAANVIFESLGGAEKYQAFAKEKMGLDETQIRFLNGSGDRYDYEDGKSAYNEATCEAILANIGTLKAELALQNHTLPDVLALAGSDPDGERSTVSSIYGNEVTNNALIAKTGTVSPSVTLAGMASTEQGDVYFGYIYGTEGTMADWREARNSIRKEVVALFRRFSNKKEIEYTAEKFITFDSDSKITVLEDVKAAVSKPDLGDQGPLLKLSTDSVKVSNP